MTINDVLQTGTMLLQIVVAGVVAYGTAAYGIGKQTQKIETLSDDVCDLKKEIKEIRDMAIACRTNLDLRGPLLKRRSPLSLTERGLIFLESSGGQKFIDDHAPELINKVREKNPKTAYDVQELSNEIVANLKDDEKMNPLKEFLFKDGSSLDDLVTVMGDYLRDKILRELNWNVEDIDKHSPMTKK
mgnify:CR=1 FL=1